MENNSDQRAETFRDKVIREDIMEKVTFFMISF